jgi:capsular polysaccharide biosynthesis protein
LYIDVLRRHRLLVVSGIAVTLALAWLSYVRVSESGLAYRKSEIWSSEATLIVSGPSQPEWRSVLPASVQPDRFTSLVDVYAELATSDAVMASLRRQGLREAENGVAPITATAVHSTFNGTPTPLLKITAMATSPAGARSLATRATDAFIDVLASRQAEANIPEGDRIQLRIVKRSSVPTLTQPRSKTTFIIILLAGLITTIAAAFMRENTRRPAANRQPHAEPAFVVDRIQRAGEAVASPESESIRAYEQNGTETNETDDESDQAVRRRWSAGSSG